MIPRACPVCGADRPAWTRTRRDCADRRVRFTLVRCGECEVVYVDPAPSDAEQRGRSREYQALMRGMLEDLRDSRIGQLGLGMMRRSRTPPGPRRGRVLDVGCSYGDYLARLRSLGWDPVGIEFDAEASRHAREGLGLDVRSGRAEDRLPELPDASFDLVTMWHVLEHLSDPGGVLEHVWRVLRPGGRLIVEVPNYGSLGSRLLRDFWFPLEYPHHLFHFTPSSLRGLLLRAGFESPRIAGQPAPAETTWSLHMAWHALTGREWDRRLLWTPTGVVALYPLEAALAALGLSNHMRAVAGKA